MQRPFKITLFVHEVSQAVRLTPDQHIQLGCLFSERLAQIYNSKVVLSQWRLVSLLARRRTIILNFDDVVILSIGEGAGGPTSLPIKLGRWPVRVSVARGLVVDV